MPAAVVHMKIRGLTRVTPAKRLIIQKDLTRFERIQPQNGSQQGAFPASHRSSDSHERTGWDLQRYILQGRLSRPRIPESYGMHFDSQRVFCDPGWDGQGLIQPDHSPGQVGGEGRLAFHARRRRQQRLQASVGRPTRLNRIKHLWNTVCAPGKL